MTSQIADSRTGQLLWERYGTEDKLANAQKLQEAVARSMAHVDARPWRVTLDPCSVCNLKCCRSALKDTALPSGYLNPRVVETYLRDLWPYLVQVNLFNWGEPLLNDDLPEIIRIINDHRVGTQVHSNMNVLSDKLALELATSGLDVLVASIDGVSQSVYEKYREGGNVQIAISNLKRLVQSRNRQETSQLKIIWRYLCFPHTACEIENAKALSEEIGVDEFVVGNGSTADGTWCYEAGTAALAAGSSEKEPPYCTDPFDFPKIHWDGKVLPCCYAVDQGAIFGDLTTQTWSEIFSGKAFINSRRAVCGSKEVQSACCACWKCRV